ncbi:DNA repair protein rad50 [Dermatophagoides pteronyssinus]|uniref:DNA repair protein rad50 n=1 Tax=Dermatophagoides pteronyssinus TaxID=6956 RepID=A0ABQ8JLS9_DERPT|nr:DNA repair protein rad50 [Dermatophagoides pteronyssinus]
MEIEFRKSEQQDLQTKIDTIQNEMKNLPGNFLTKLDAEISNLEMELNKINQKQNEIDSKTEIDRLEERKKSLRSECDSLKEQIQHDQQQQKFLDYFKSEQQKIKTEMKTIRMNNLELFKEISVDCDNFSEKLSTLIDKKHQDFDAKINEIKNIEQQLSEQTILLKNQKELLATNENKLNSMNEKLNGICSIDEYNDYRLKIENDLSELRKEKANEENMTKVMDKFITIIDQNKVCPICEQDLSGDWQSANNDGVNRTFTADKLIKKLEQCKCENPERLAMIMNKIENIQQKYNQLLLIQNDIESIPDWNRNISECNVEIKKASANIENLQQSLIKNNTESNSIKSMINEWQKCLQQANKYDNLFRENIDLNTKLHSFGYSESQQPLKSLEESNKQLQSKEFELKTCDSQLSKIQSDYFEMIEQKSRLQNQLQLAERNRIEYLQKQQNHMQNIQKQKEFMEKLKQNDGKLIDLVAKLTEINPKIETLQNEMNDHRKKWQNNRETMQQTIQSQRTTLQSLKTIGKEVENSLEKLKELQSKISGDYLDNLDKQLSKFEMEKKSIVNELNMINEMIIKFELNKRQLLDRQLILNLHEEIQEKESQLKEFKDKIGSSSSSTNITTIRETRIRAERERQTMATLKETSKTKIKDLLEKIKEIDDEINNNDEYRNANKYYNEKCIDKVISELNCEDLDKFYKSLDNTITSVHMYKMEDINKLIDQFWRVSYQGNDIESIQIMVDQGERSASALRRTYHYRVVMIKQGKTLDMRGRCSAGQKVLACLIIRIALALLFSNNFTVITLDEPTTNLDNANIRALAKAIVKLRKMNEHLQIIIITHDEDFLQSLSTDDYVDQYYKVFKNDNGYSTIELHSIHSEQIIE